MKNKPLVLLIVLLLAASAAPAQILKSNNDISLDQAGSWVGDVAPGSGSVAVWDSTVLTATNCTNTLEAPVSWGGIQIFNPAADITILNSTNTLTLGGEGIDLDEATSTANLSLDVPVTNSVAQNWNIAPGLALTLNAPGTPIQIGSDLAVNGDVRVLSNSDFRVSGNLYLTNAATVIDFTESPGLSLSVGYGTLGSGTGTVIQSNGVVKLRKNSTSTGCLLLGAANAFGNGTYDLYGGILEDTNATVNDYFSIGDGTDATGTLNVYGGTVWVPQIQLGNDGYGILNVYGGAVTTSNNDLEICKGGSALPSSLNVYGGTVNIIAANLDVGYKGLSGFGSGALLVTNGVIYVGKSLEVPAGNSGSSPGTFTMDGGTMIITNNIEMLVKGAGGGTIYLNGGTVEAEGVTVGADTGIGNFYFNSGTLAATENKSPFIVNTNIITYNVDPGGAVINNAGFTLTIPAPLIHDPNVSGTDGGLTSLGAGTLTLSGDNSYYGPTTVGGGTLTVGTTNLAGGTILQGSATVVVTNGTLNTVLTTNGTTLVCSNLVFVNAGATNAIQFSCGTNSDPTVPLIYATNNLTVNGTVTVNITGSGLSVGTIPLIQYNGSIGGSGTLALGVLQGGLGYITNNVAAHQVQAVINGSGAVLDWRAYVNTNWDTITANWWNLSNLVAAVYSQGSVVYFDDSTSNSYVNVSGSVAPFAMTINNTFSNYVFAGTGGISGFSGVTKLGTGNVTMALNNSYSGQTIISNGVFTLGATNAIPSTSDTVVQSKLDLAGYSTGVHSLNGNGVVDNSGSNPGVLTIGGNGGTFVGLITNSGSGSLTLDKASGASMYLLNANNGYSGGTTNTGGLLQLATEHSIGTGPLTLQGNLAWEPTDTNPHALSNGVAITGNVTFGNTNDVNGPLTVDGTVNLTGNAPSFTCDEDVWLPGGVTNGTIVNKDGPGELVLENSVNLATSTPRVDEGDWVVTNNCIIGVNGDNFRLACEYAEGLSEVDIYPGCELLLTNHSTGNIDVGAEDVTDGGGCTNILNIEGLVEVQADFDPSDGALRLGNTADAEDIVNLLPGGVLHAHWIDVTSTGPTTELNFNGGTLLVYTNDDASIFLEGLTAANVLDGGAIIDTAGYDDITVGQSLQAGGTGIGGLTKQGLGTLLLANNNTYTGPTLITAGGLGGSGTIISPVTVENAASLMAGSSTNIGTFTINNTVTFDSSSSAVMKISVTNDVPYNDQIADVTTIHYNGTLVVTTNIDMNGPFALGDTFTLFSATSYTGSFTGYSLPTLPSGLGWNTSQLGVNGSIQIVTAPTSPPAFNSVVLKNGDLILSGTNGQASQSYVVLSSTDVALPLNQWTPIATNSFNSSGNFSFTNAVNSTNQAQYFDISAP